MDQSKLTLPVAILAAGVLIAGSIVLTQYGKKTNVAINNQNIPETPTNIIIDPVTSADHILGNPNADIVLVEYSDLECPFCKQFQATLHKVMDTYSKDNKFAWVYRHFPLDKPDSTGVILHSKAGKESEASECAAELGGNAKFWNFIDKIYAITPSNNGLDLKLLPEIAGSLGIDKAKFIACQESGRHKEKVQAQYEDGVRAGGTGTPYSVIITKKGDKIPITLGALPYPQLKNVIEALLNSMK